MNKKVLHTMIILCWVFLGIYALLKLIPQMASKFVIVVNNERIVEAGKFIDERVWLQQIIYGLTTLLTYHFYLCACCHKWFLSWKQYIVLAVVIAATNTLKYYVPGITVQVNVLIMVIYPFLLKSDYRTFIIIFITHSVGQLLISFIRGAEMPLADCNTLTCLICCLDMYVWLLLYYLYSNLYKGEKFMGNVAPPFWDKMKKEINAEIAYLDKKIAECKDTEQRKKYEAKRAEYEEMRIKNSSKK